MDTRIDPPLEGDERATLVGFLDFQRATLAMKCEGLDAEQLARRASPPSTLSLLGLLRHLAEVELGWFRDVERRHNTGIYWTEAEPNLEFDGALADPVQVEQAYADWRREIDHADRMIADNDLGTVFTRVTDGKRFSLRWIIAHMIEEYARHNGHADLLREAIDGTTGE